MSQENHKDKNKKKSPDDVIHQKLTQIASKYKILECEECADEIQNWLKRNGIEGAYLKIRARIGDFIISNRVGGHQSITWNGIHYGVEVRGKVFDNLPGTGISRRKWLSDFQCLGGFDLTEGSI